MAECNQCGKTIRFSKNPAGKWIPFDPDGECHFATCNGKPAAGSRKDLLNQVSELEEQLETYRKKVASLQYTNSRLQTEHQQMLAQYREIQQYLYTPWQQVINTGKALARARNKKTGRARYHYKRLLKALDQLLDAEAKQKARIKAQ